MTTVKNSDSPRSGAFLRHRADPPAKITGGRQTGCRDSLSLAQAVTAKTNPSHKPSFVGQAAGPSKRVDLSSASAFKLRADAGDFAETHKTFKPETSS